MVADELRRRGEDTVVPELGDERLDLPHWQRYGDCVAAALRAVGNPVVFVAHSGAGPLLPSLAEASSCSPAGYVFVDAALPVPGLSRLDALRSEAPGFADELHAHLAGGGRFPEWSEEEVQEVVPKRELRTRFMDEIRPRGRDFFDEVIPVPSEWPDAPCAYLQFAPVYDLPAAQARARGWPCERVDGGHFHMLVDPAAVASALLRLVA